MKFLISVLVIHFINELVHNKRKDNVKAVEEEKPKAVIHPAEFMMR
jgi:hypothetical protein